MSTKILDLIPQSLHEDLITEVLALIEEKAKAKAELEKNEVSPMVIAYLENEKKERQRQKEFFEQQQEILKRKQ